MGNHVTIGVYPNGDYLVNIVDPDHLEFHIEYNKLWRFGRGLFVDGECVNPGYLSDEKVAEWKEKISMMTFNTQLPTVPYQ